MSEFLDLLPPTQALDALLSHLAPRPVPVEIETNAALGRITTQEVKAPFTLPAFPRSTVDGYAVQASETFGANESLPAYLQVAGEVLMGMVSPFALQSGQAGLIHTGGYLPEGADAVVMVEHTQEVRPGEVEINRAVAVGENVIQVGEDITQGEVVVGKGAQIQPAEIGGLMALGVLSLQVARQPKVGILSSGDEIVPPDVDLMPGQVRDINTYTLSALVKRAGGQPVSYGIIPDDQKLLWKAAAQALVENDLVVLTAGSSVSARDLTGTVINMLGQPGVLVHGVNIRPGKPTILAMCDGKPVIGLPGNPVSALVIARLFVVPVIERLQGKDRTLKDPTVTAQLRVNLSSASGREDWVAVRLVESEQGLFAEPIFGKSNLIFTLANADGLVRIPADANGLAVHELVQVHLL